MYRSRAPLRLGLAGGGTDVSPYSDEYGGAILNSTISLYSYASISERTDGKIVFRAEDRNEFFETEETDEIAIDGLLDLHKGVYNRIVKQFTNKPLSFELTTFSDAPAGSGLGTSSTMVVAILGAFVEWLKLPLGEYDIARLAYQIEREDLMMAGGKQDQYAATFGGVNFMEFFEDNKVIVNPLRIKDEVLYELENNLVLYNTATSRVSAEIIKSQTENIKKNKATSIEAMDKLKEQAFRMKEVLLKGNLNEIGEILDFGWKFKKNLASGITNPQIDEIYDSAKANGALGGKISGAGGGGFFFFYCPGNTRYKVIQGLEQFGGRVRKYHFRNEGLMTWNSDKL
jgi:D-glycero-alpha-D-manno-heptose-7-phosphate kinase